MTSRVEQLMSRNVATCRLDDALNRAACLMWERDCGVVPVTVPEEGGERVVGMLTDRDICMAAYTQGASLATLPVRSAMSHEVRTCGPKDSVASAMRILATGQVHRLPVIDDAGHLVGLLSLADLAREEARSHKTLTAEELSKTIEAISAPRTHALVIAA